MHLGKANYSKVSRGMLKIAGFITEGNNRRLELTFLSQTVRRCCQLSSATPTRQPDQFPFLSLFFLIFNSNFDDFTFYEYLLTYYEYRITFCLLLMSRLYSTLHYYDRTTFATGTMAQHFSVSYQGLYCLHVTVLNWLSFQIVTTPHRRTRPRVPTSTLNITDKDHDSIHTSPYQDIATNPTIAILAQATDTMFPIFDPPFQACRTTGRTSKVHTSLRIPNMVRIKGITSQVSRERIITSILLCGTTKCSVQEL